MALIDARTLPDASRIEADLVIIGGGMAGITLARELAGGPLRIAILEGGGQEIEAASQALYAGQAVMCAPGGPDKPCDDYLTQSRMRALGGSGHVWGGKCVPLDPADFAARPQVPHSGWPMSRDDLQPFYDRACDLLQIPRFATPGATPPIDPKRPPLELDDGFFSAPRVFTRLSGGVDRPAFDRFRTEFAQAANITVYLHANVTQIRLTAAGDRVEALEIATLEGRHHTATGKTYILATGGIENARLLLASNRVRPAGVGNRHDLVGRFFQGHQVYSAHADAETDGSAIQLSGPRSTALYLFQGQPQGAHCVLAQSLSGQRRRAAGNFTVTLSPSQMAPPSAAGPGPGRAETQALRQAATALDGQGPGPLAPCFVMSEHFPNPDSRITLTEARDPLGMPRIHLAWTYSAADWTSLETSVAGFAEALGAAGVGRFCWPIARADLLKVAGASRHHMGTTRMHADPAQGVVDPDLRVHDTPNLYIAGSSVFPTSGIGNPTLTLLALTLRLADHLKSGAAA